MAMGDAASAISQPPVVVVHRSRAFRHIALDLDPPVTSRADTVLDMAVAEPDARTARRTLTALLVTGKVRPSTVRRRLTERPPRRYRRALASAVDLVRDGVHSALEQCYAVEVEGAHDLPVGRGQGPVLVDGVTLFEDVVYDDAGAALTVRLDGRTHLISSVAFRGRRRDNAAELAGRSRLIFGRRDLSRDPCGAAREVATVLTRRGWTAVRPGAIGARRGREWQGVRQHSLPLTGGYARDAPPPPARGMRMARSSEGTGEPPSLLTVPTQIRPSGASVAAARRP